MADDWYSEALCASDTFKQLAWQAGAERDPSQVFFPIECDGDGKDFKKGKKPKSYQIMEARFERLARATCSACPVRTECLMSHMELESEPYGIVGGLDPQARAALWDNPVVIEGTCKCGITLFGAKGAMPKACSGNCRG